MAKISAQQLTTALGAVLSGIDFGQPLSDALHDAVYHALLDHQVIFLRGQDIAPQAHLAFAHSIGTLYAPHPHYPHGEGFEAIVKLENDADRPMPAADTAIRPSGRTSPLPRFWSRGRCRRLRGIRTVRAFAPPMTGCSTG